MSRADGILRLLHLREQTEAVGETMADRRGRFAALADPASAPRVVTAFNLFQTPAALAARCAALLSGHVGPESVVLEPSAGLGRLYRAARDAGHTGPMVLVDISPDCCRELYGMTAGDNVTLKQGDFLTMRLGPFDGVLMNPPFANGADIKHIRHAAGMLKPGGRLVAICANGPRQREKLRPIAREWIDLEPGAFAESGTKVSAAIVVIDG